MPKVSFRMASASCESTAASRREGDVPSRDVQRPADDNAIRRDPDRVVRCWAAVEVRVPVCLGRSIGAWRQLTGTLGVTAEDLDRLLVLLDAQRGTRHLAALPVGRKV